MSILILGGTFEADGLADILSSYGIEFTYALAGITQNPKSRAYPIHTGGFGGSAGLTQYLTRHAIKMIIDATHPFAQVISEHAAKASSQTNTPILRLERPPWPEPENAGWVHVADLDAAARALPKAARVFLSVGSRSMGAFAYRTDVTFISRSIVAPIMPFGKIILARPPFDLEGEMRLFRENSITHLVSKNSGGQQTSAKLAAAKNLDITVILVERPPAIVAEVAADIATAMAWIERRL